MDTTKHTPGPWEIVGGIFVDGPDDKSIYAGSSLRRSYDECQANAQLISAAPELLQELKHAVARVQLSKQEGITFLSAWLPDAKKAIAKAEGETQND